jgi:phosphoglycolate phosphatase
LNTPPIDPLVILFDIDGTLIDSAGAGGRALFQSLAAEFELEQVQPVTLHGRTDLGIMTELLELNQLAATSDHLRRLCDRYFTLLPTELSRCPGRILPGVEQILAAITGHKGCHVGLLTGNMLHSARFKLEHYGLWNFFRFGIYGDQATHRPQLCQPAITAVQEHIGEEFPSDRIVVIGDTPLDVELAQAMGARSLAVCTGGFAASSLTAAGAESVVDDLSQTEMILDWLLN